MSQLNMFSTKDDLYVFTFFNCT